MEHQGNSAGKAGTIPNYEPRGRFLDPREIAAYNVLLEVFGDGVGVFPKVALADLTAKFRPSEEQISHWTKVQFRRIDFLICAGPELEPLLAITLESRSKSERRRSQGWDVIDDVLGDLGLPLLRLTAQKKYDINDITRKINFTIQENNGASRFLFNEPPVTESEDGDVDLENSSYLSLSSTLSFLTSVRDKYRARARRLRDKTPR